MEWRDIAGYEGLYRVNRLGQVESYDRIVPSRGGGTRRHTGRVMKPSPVFRNGRLNNVRLSLRRDGASWTVPIHRLVLLTWVGPCPDGHEGCHKDGNPANNAVSNLRWGTRSSNVRDAHKHGTAKTCPVVRSDGTVYASLHEAGRCVGGYPQNIWKACNGYMPTAYGYSWEYAQLEQSA